MITRSTLDRESGGSNPPQGNETERNRGAWKWNHKKSLAHSSTFHQLLQTTFAAGSHRFRRLAGGDGKRIYSKHCSHVCLLGYLKRIIVYHVPIRSMLSNKDIRVKNKKKMNSINLTFFIDMLLAINWLF
jgi:hypothetical protein